MVMREVPLATECKDAVGGECIAQTREALTKPTAYKWMHCMQDELCPQFSCTSIYAIYLHGSRCPDCRSLHIIRRECLCAELGRCTYCTGMTHSTSECAREGRVPANENRSVDTASNKLGMSTPIVAGQQTSLNSASLLFLILLYRLGLFRLFSQAYRDDCGSVRRIV